MKKKGTKILAFLICGIMILGVACTPQSSNNVNQGGINAMIIEKNNIPLVLWYDEEAPTLSTENNPIGTTFGSYTADDSWEEWSLPIGNGYFGANVFGRTETERIQISEKTLTNPNEYISENSVGGLNSFSETYIDFGHRFNDVRDYKRYLDLETAISGVSYTYDEVTYTREYFTSYPDKALIIRLDASEEGALSFTLRPTIPYEQDYLTTPGDKISKHGTVTSSVEGGVGYIELSGKMGYYDIDFLGIYKVYTNGGTVEAKTTNHTYVDTAGIKHTDVDGTIEVTNATSAYIIITLGTDYELSSDIFLADAELNQCLTNESMSTSSTIMPTQRTNLDDTREKVEEQMIAIEDLIYDKSFNEGYETLKNRHIADHSELFSRVTIDLDCDPIDFTCTTDELLYQYQLGYQSNYLEILVFQYGRYMLIASSREGSLPAHLQGVWNTYNSPPWSCNYTHNINVQMNYWPAFSTNLSETFIPYINFNRAYMEAAEKWADLAIIWNNLSDKYNKDGDNGWVLGHTVNPYKVTYDSSPGNLGLTTQMFWEYYQYTQDKEMLEAVVYPVLYSAAQFITKTVIQDENGNYLVANCDSPEQFVNGQWYYTTGTTYAQSFCYLNNYHLLLAAQELGIDLENNSVLSKSENAVLKTVLEQIDKYDPIIVGLSGQVKEFREEEYYGGLGEWQHRHIAQAVGIYPGNIINSTTPAWIDAAKVTLTERGIGGVGWSAAYKLLAWARTKDGNTAHDILENLIANCMTPNLWDVHFAATKDIFQIDGNFGATAGVAEFLLQSDAGYIEPLAALPDAWYSGSYTGLVARGNFEVSASWRNGLANCFNITSKSGGKASVYYPSITKATVCKADGTPVSYTVDGKNLISFETEVGETYIIYGFKEQKKIEAPTNFNAQRNDSQIVLTWDHVDSAVKYNVYIAIDSQSDYTFLGSTSDTMFDYTVEGNPRMTFVVTAVSSDSTESERTLCYSNPIYNNPDNILAGKKFVGAPGTSYDTNDGLDFSYAKLTDGDFGQNYGDDNWKYGRFSTYPNGHADGTIDLGGAYILNELRLYCWAGEVERAGTNFTLQVYYNGVWTTVYSNLTTEQLATHAVNNGVLNHQRYISLDMGSIKAEKIRFYSESLPNNTVTMYEIECSGRKI